MAKTFGDMLAESILPDKIDTFKILGYTPTERQRAFHEASTPESTNFAILYGGAAGGGKSCAFLMDAIYNAVNYPGIRIGIFRKSYPELDESFIGPLFARWEGAAPLGARWNGTQHILRFPNGSVINFVFAETTKDVTRVQGGEYQIEYIDEGTLMEPAVIQQLQERIRSGTKKVPVIGIRISGNPGGPSHQYLQDRFIKTTHPTKGGRVREWFGTNKSKSRWISFIPANVDDNPHLNEDYTDNLDSIADPQRRKAMRNGDWTARVGQFFTQWSDKRHIVDSFPLPREWRRYAGIDFGTTNPFAVVWAAIDNDGRMWVYREIKATGLNSDVQARYIISTETDAGEQEIIRTADPSMWGDRGTLYSIADDYGRNGCGIFRANNNRPNGWAICHRFLAEAPACALHAEMGWKTCPMLHVFGDKCPSFCEDIPNLMVDPIKPDDANTGGDDHIPDAWRYLCMAVGTTAQPVFYRDNQDDEEQEPLKENDDSQPVLRPKTYDQLYAGFPASPFRDRAW